MYVSEVVRHTLNPVWVPFQSEGDLLTDAPETGDGSAPVPNIQHLLCSGTAFEVSVIRVTERRPRRTRRKSRAMSRTAPIVDDDEGWQPANNSRSFADARDPFEDAEAAEEDEPDEPVKDEQPEEEEVLRMAFNVRELEPLPTALADIASLPLNTCLFEFAGRTFVHRDVLDALADSGLSSVKHSRRKGSAIQLKEYSLHEGVDHLERVRAIREKIDARSRSNEQLRTQIQLRLARAQPHISRDQQRAVLEERVRAARQRVGDQRDVLARLRTVMQDERKTFETDIHIPKALLSTMQMSMHYKDEKQGILERRCEVLRAAHKIRSRQAMLVKQLSNVYPIEYVGAGEYKIRGIRIANSDLNGSARADEEMVSTALGYIAHLVFMLSKYLHVNLRYRVVPYSSRSYLKDEINDPLGEYPLYKKGAERDRHEKAVHFLKKDVEQVRLLCIDGGMINGRVLTDKFMCSCCSRGAWIRHRERRSWRGSRRSSTPRSRGC